MDASKIAIPVSTPTFVGLVDFLREVGSDRDPVAAVETAINYWIDNASWKQADLLPETVADVPTKIRGYMWKELFLPHGSHLRMRYRSEFHYTQVEGDGITYLGNKVSPGEFANTVTGTSRNAWKDLWIKRPDDTEWRLANDLRRAMSMAAAPRIHFHDDIFDELLDLGGRAHRSKVINGVYQRRKNRGDSLPKKFEETVQQSFQQFCGESAVFRGNPELDLFCWPDGKGSGYWGLNRANVEKYLESRRIPSADEL